jgi:hypothetical protein
MPSEPQTSSLSRAKEGISPGNNPSSQKDSFPSFMKDRHLAFMKSVIPEGTTSFVPSFMTQRKSDSALYFMLSRHHDCHTHVIPVRHIAGMTGCMKYCLPDCQMP